MAWGAGGTGCTPRANELISTCFRDADTVVTLPASKTTYSGNDFTGGGIGLAGKIIDFGTSASATFGSSRTTHTIPSFIYTPIGAKMNRQLCTALSTSTANSFTPAYATIIMATTLNTGYSFANICPSNVFAQTTPGLFGSGAEVTTDVLTQMGSLTRYIDCSFFLPASQFLNGIKANLSFREMVLQSAIYHDLRSYRNKWLRAKATITNVVRTSNVVTLTFSSHPYGVGDVVTVTATTNTGVNTTAATITAKTATTVTYTLAGADIASGADTGYIGAPLKVELYSGTALSSVDPDAPPTDPLLATFYLYTGDFGAAATTTGKFTLTNFQTVNCVATGTVAYAKLIAATTSSGLPATLFIPVNTAIADDYVVLSSLSAVSGNTLQLIDLGFQIGMY